MYDTKEQRKDAVLLGEMLREARMTWELVVYLIGLFLVMAGFILRNSSIAVFGQIIIVGTVITYLIELSRTFRYLLCDPHHIVDIDSQLH